MERVLGVITGVIIFVVFVVFVRPALEWIFGIGHTSNFLPIG